MRRRFATLTPPWKGLVFEEIFHTSPLLQLPALRARVEAIVNDSRAVVLSNTDNVVTVPDLDDLLGVGPSLHNPSTHDQQAMRDQAYAAAEAVAAAAAAAVIALEKKQKPTDAEDTDEKEPKQDSGAQKSKVRAKAKAKVKTKNNTTKKANQNKKKKTEEKTEEKNREKEQESQ